MATRIVQIPVPIEVVRAANRAAADARKVRERMRDTYESNAEVQRNRGRSKDDMIREAKERMIGNVKEFNDAMKGTDTTRAEAEKKVDELTRKLARDQGRE